MSYAKVFRCRGLRRGRRPAAKCSQQITPSDVTVIRPLLREGTDTTVAQFGRQIFVTDWLCDSANYTRDTHFPPCPAFAHNFSPAFAQRGSPCRRARMPSIRKA